MFKQWTLLKATMLLKYWKESDWLVKLFKFYLMPSSNVVLVNKTLWHLLSWLLVFCLNLDTHGILPSLLERTSLLMVLIFIKKLELLLMIGITKIMKVSERMLDVFFSNFWLRLHSKKFKNLFTLTVLLLIFSPE